MRRQHTDPIYTDPPQTSGRHAFVIVRRTSGGTRLHLTDDAMYKWTLEWGTQTSHVTALCGLKTRYAHPETEDILKETERDGQWAVKRCPRCWKENER